MGAIILSLFDTMYYVYAGLPGLLTTVNAISAQNPMSFPGMMIGTLATIIITVVLVQIVGCDELPLPADAPRANAAPSGPSSSVSPSKTAEVTVVSPLNGTVTPLSQVKDPTFADEILGKGIAIYPSEGKLYAPFDGTVLSVVDSRHAINLSGPNQIELLIHIGLDTVELGGAGYSVMVQNGDRIKTGDLLIEFDLEKICQNYEAITPVLVTNAEDFALVAPRKVSGPIKVGDPLLQVKPKQENRREEIT